MQNELDLVKREQDHAVMLRALLQQEPSADTDILHKVWHKNTTTCLSAGCPSVDGSLDAWSEEVHHSSHEISKEDSNIYVRPELILGFTTISTSKTG